MVATVLYGALFPVKKGAVVAWGAGFLPAVLLPDFVCQWASFARPSCLRGKGGPAPPTQPHPIAWVRGDPMLRLGLVR